MSYPKQCPECGADWTKRDAVQERATVTAWNTGRMDENGEWEEDGNEAEASWDTYTSDAFVCAACNHAVPA